MSLAARGYSFSVCLTNSKLSWSFITANKVQQSFFFFCLIDCQWILVFIISREVKGKISSQYVWWLSSPVFEIDSLSRSIIWRNTTVFEILRNLLTFKSFGRSLLETGGYFWVTLNSWKKQWELCLTVYKISYYLWIHLCLLYRLVMGWLQFLEAGRKFDCISSPTTVRMKEIIDWVNFSHSGI